MKMEVDARTIAQYLNDGFDRFDGNYILTDKKDQNEYGAVIIDESSMLTEEMLGTTLDCLKNAKRIILVGDHRQLPPIGAGKPFIDIINHLRTKKKGIAELRINFRQRTEDGEIRDDMLLANFFAGDDKIPHADSVFDVLTGKQSSDTLRCVRWKESDDFEKEFYKILSKELNLTDITDIKGFDETLGAKLQNGYSYFNRGEAVEKIEDWQVLSPVRGKYFGVNAINHMIHKQFHDEMIRQSSNYRNTKFPYPFGNEQIVYGDKVINVQNHRRYKVWPENGSLKYIANGEIGIVIGQTNFKNGSKPKMLNIDFSTQSGFSYTFYHSEFGEEKQAADRACLCIDCA